MNTWEPIFDGETNFSMAMIGSRRSGKTTLLKWLVREHMERYFDQIVLITNTLSNDIYTDFAPEDKLTSLSTFDNNVIQGLIDIQTEDGPDADRVLVILDDSVGNNVKYSQGILKLFCTGRNLNMSIIYSVQDGTLLHPAHRENLDFLIVMRVKTFPKIKHIIDTFLMGNLESGERKTTAKEEFNVWERLLKDVTTDHGALVVDYIQDKMLKFKLKL